MTCFAIASQGLSQRADQSSWFQLALRDDWQAFRPPGRMSTSFKPRFPSQNEWSCEGRLAVVAAASHFAITHETLGLAIENDSDRPEIVQSTNLEVR